MKENRITPYGNYVLLEKIEQEKKGLLYIKDKQRFQRAKVLGAGKGIDERFHDVMVQFEPGAEVLYDSGGVMLYYDGLMLVSIENIYGVFE